MKLPFIRLLISVSIFTAIVLPGFSPVQAEPPPDVLGFRPAYSETPVELPLPESMREWREAHSVACRLSISSEGSIDSVALEREADSIWAYRLMDTLRNVRLRPARLEGASVASLLPASIAFRPRSRQALLELPVEPDGTVRRYPDYLECLRLNHIQPAQVDSFPKYFFERAEVDSLVDIPPWVLIHAQVDSTGALMESEVVLSTLSTYDRQIANAVKWADFAPASVRGNNVESSLWLVFTVYSQVIFPAPAWRASDLDSMGIWERLRLRALPDTIGLMHYPLPRRPDPLSWSKRGEHVRLRDTVATVLTVDTLGWGKIRVLGSHDNVTLSAMRRAVADTRFWPAVGFDGSPREFEGLMYFVFTGERTVRMVFPWLPE